jgi:hypothetical protein
MKRHNPLRRSLAEQRADSNSHYGTYIKKPSKKSIFTEKPHYGLEVEKKC